MNNNDQKILSQMLNKGIMDDEIIKMMQDHLLQKTKKMIKDMGSKYGRGSICFDCCANKMMEKRSKN